MAGALKIRVSVDPRRGDRLPVVIPATAWLPGEDPVSITIAELSSFDLRATIPLELEAGALIRIGLPTGSAPHALVTRIEEDRVGCRFMSPIGVTEFTALTGDNGDRLPPLS